MCPLEKYWGIFLKCAAMCPSEKNWQLFWKCTSMCLSEKNWYIFKMQSNVPIGKNIDKYLKCAAMWPSENIEKYFENSQQCGQIFWKYAAMCPAAMCQLGKKKESI